MNIKKNGSRIYSIACLCCLNYGLLAIAQTQEDYATKDSSIHEALATRPVDALSNLVAEPQWAEPRHFQIDIRKADYVDSVSEETVSVRRVRRVHRRNNSESNPK